MQACSVIARNFLPHARVLAESFLARHPRGRFALLVVDDVEREIGDGEPFEALRARDLGMSPRELHRRALLYPPQGLISSLRPRLVRHLLDRGEEAVLLLDADMLVLDGLDDLFELATREALVLSPHLTEPLPGGPDSWAEEELLRSGTFNGGLLGVGQGGGAFLEWIAARTDRDCVQAPERGLFFSQTWLNLVPALFPHHVLRDRGVNAMVHNLGDQDLEEGEGGPQVAGAPLRLFHFTGFDPARPEDLCRYEVAAPTALGERPVLARLCREYGDRLRARGWPGDARREYGFERLSCGIPVDPLIRSLYRRELLGAERGNGPEPPDPFDRRQAGAFLDWLREPSPQAPGPPAVSRYLLALHTARQDLRAAFPDVPGADSEGYLGWAATKGAGDHGADPGEIPAQLTGTRPPRRGVRRPVRALRERLGLR